MTTLTSDIASWNRDELGAAPFEPFEMSQAEIATECPKLDDMSQWRECIDALLRALRLSDQLDDGIVTPPEPKAIRAAIHWLRVLQPRFPQAPPTRIGLEPGGGIIIERRVETARGDNLIAEITVYNSGLIENTVFRNGRVESMTSISPARDHVSRRD